jgi:hypothetical protein
MRFSGWVCAFVLSFVSFGAFAQANTNCISQQEMTEIAQSFRQFANLAKGDYCLDESPTSRLLSGIMFMRKTAFMPAMPLSKDELFSGKFSQNWWQYFIGRIDNFQIESNCQKGVIAYVFFFGNDMHVCPPALTANFTSLDLASVFMHEARHIDGFPHVTCSRGPRAGLQGACDTRIADGGSYAVTVETYAQIAKYSVDVHPALKAYARASSVIYADEAFENPVRIDRAQQLLLMTTSKDFFTIDPTSAKLTQLGQSPALGHIVMRAQHMILFPEDKSLKAKYLFVNNEGEINQEAGDTAIEYNTASPAERNNWVDVHVGTQWVAKILKDKVVFACDPRSARLTEVATNGEVPVSALYPNGYDRAASSANLVMQSGRIMEFGCQGTSAFLRPSNVTFDQTYKRIYKIGTEVVGLSQDGKLFRIQGNTSSQIQTSVDGRITEIAPRQTYSFFD